MWHKTMLGLMYKLYPGVSVLVQQNILLLMMEKVFANPADDDGESNKHAYRRWWLVVLCVVFTGNFALQNIFDNLFCGLKLGGAATLKLRTAVMTKALRLSPASQALFPAGRITETMDAQVETAISFVWAASFKLVQELFRLLCLCGYTVYLVTKNVVENDGGADSVWPAIGFILVVVAGDTVLFLARVRRQEELDEVKYKCDDEWNEYAMEACDLAKVVNACVRCAQTLCPPPNLFPPG